MLSDKAWPAVTALFHPRGVQRGRVGALCGPGHSKLGLMFYFYGLNVFFFIQVSHEIKCHR